MIEQQQYSVQQAQEEEEEASRPPPGPYRVDTTGLSTANLPKPPVRRLDSGSSQPRPPPRQIAPSPAARAPLPPPRSTPTPPTAPSRQQPALPPRLPPRQNSRPDLNSPAPPPAYTELDHPTTSVPAPDQGAMNRLARAGVSVPGFDIGSRNSPAPTPSTFNHASPECHPRTRHRTNQHNLRLAYHPVSETWFHDKQATHKFNRVSQDSLPRQLSGTTLRILHHLLLFRKKPSNTPAPLLLHPAPLHSRHKLCNLAFRG
jgi:hypothetical protein